MEAHASTSAATVVQVETAVGAPAPQAASTSQSAAPPAEHLVLRLAPKKKQKKDRGTVQWADDAVDNEFMGKKKSKKCCIFHKQRPFGEWSDDEDSDSECGECKENQEEQPPS